MHAGRADAILVFEFTQQGADVQLDVSGSLMGLPEILATVTTACSFGFVNPSGAEILVGCPANSPLYSLSGGPASFGTGNLNSLTGYSGSAVFLQAAELALPSAYVEGGSIAGTGLFAGKTLSSLGLSSTTPGALLGTWTIGSDSIEVRIGGGGGAAVPGPLPLFGAAAAFAHSRRLRVRVRAGSSTTV